MAPNKINTKGAEGLEEIRHGDAPEEAEAKIVRNAQRIGAHCYRNDRDWEGATAEEILTDLFHVIDFPPKNFDGNYGKPIVTPSEAKVDGKKMRISFNLPVMNPETHEYGVLLPPGEAKASWAGIFRRIWGPLTDMGKLLVRKLRGE